eukprot:8154776-Karenia_brevis.AAC.1
MTTTTPMMMIAWMHMWLLGICMAVHSGACVVPAGGARRCSHVRGLRTCRLEHGQAPGNL